MCTSEKKPRMRLGDAIRVRTLLLLSALHPFAHRLTVLVTVIVELTNAHLEARQTVINTCS